MAFDIDRFMTLSKAVETSDIDWDYVASHGVTDAEARIMRYMADVESHTILYLRDLLAGHNARDPEVTGFLSCWVYEETQHGRALDQFLTAAGRPPAANRFTVTAQKASFMEDVEGFLTLNAARLTPHFGAVHMVWGAVNEICAALAYTALARYTDNRELNKLLLRLAKDERRHQSFYYQQAEKRLQAHWLARMLTNTALKHFWGPVGSGVGAVDGFNFTAALLFDNPEGQEELAKMDATIARLPSLEWFNLGQKRISERIVHFKRDYPEESARLPVRVRRNVPVAVVRSAAG